MNSSVNLIDIGKKKIVKKWEKIDDDYFGSLEFSPIGRYLVTGSTYLMNFIDTRELT